MKRILYLLIIAFVLSPLTLYAEEGQTMCVVQVFDHGKNSNYEVLSTAEYETLQKKINLESKFHRKAIMTATRTWKKESPNKKKAFPKAAIYERKAVLIGEYEDITKAMAKLDSLQKQEEKEEKAKEEKAKKKLDDMSSYMGGHDKARAKLEKREKAAVEKESFLAEARVLFQMALDEIVYAADNPEAAKD
jgi:hypothetical protein